MSTGSIGELAVLMIVSWSVGRPHVRRAVHTFRFSSAATGQRVGVPPLISGWPAREKSPTGFPHTRVAVSLSLSLLPSRHKMCAGSCTDTAVIGTSSPIMYKWHKHARSLLCSCAFGFRARCALALARWGAPVPAHIVHGRNAGEGHSTVV